MSDPKTPLTLSLPSPSGSPLRLSRIAHASVLIQSGDESILTDPWFSQRGGFPGYYPGERLAMGVGELPALTGVVTGQNHYDHFDIDAFAAYHDRGVPMVVLAGTPQRETAQGACAGCFAGQRPQGRGALLHGGAEPRRLERIRSLRGTTSCTTTRFRALRALHASAPARG